MRLLALDLETTGLDSKKDSITEIGWVVKDHKESKPLSIRSLLVAPPACDEIPEDFISPEIFDITGITVKHLEIAGVDLKYAVSELRADIDMYDVEAIVAHNANFDKTMLIGNMERLLPEPTGTDLFSTIRWIDTKSDIIYPKHWYTNLTFVAASLGFLNPWPHAAVFDAFTCLKVLDNYELAPVLARNAAPWVVVRAIVEAPFRDPKPDGEKETDLARARGYRWQNCGDGKIYQKCWIKRIKDYEVTKEQAEAPFKVVTIEA